MSTEDSVSRSTPERKTQVKKKYVPAVTPRLKVMLFVVFGLFAALAANSLYLSSITVLKQITGNSYEDYFYLLNQLVHLVLGFVILVPFIIFVWFHLIATRKRKNKAAVRMGYMLMYISIALLGSGVLLSRVVGIDLKQPQVRQIVYWMHVITPLAVIWLYWLHRMAGPPIKWRVGLSFAGVVAVVVGAMVFVRAQDPRDWNTAGSPESLEYFSPSLVRTGNGKYIPEDVMMMDSYCMKCHQDIYDDWSHSVHRFSSFNNPLYLAAVEETRRVSLKNDGNVKGARFCAGCHDPVPFFSGQFDDPEYDIYNHPTAKAGITCTVCHAITNINSARGNGDYTIEEPVHYPFATSKNSLLQWVNEQLVKAKPQFHKETFLKPFHKTPEFCSVCHKVHLPKELTKYRDYQPGQNHHDTYWVSGVSGHGLQSFYYPPSAQVNCNECHMPAKESTDFGAKPRADKEAGLWIHNHLYPSANTGLAYLLDDQETVQKHIDFTKDSVRVDIFGIKKGGRIEDELIAPLRPNVPTLEPGQVYLLESVIRTLKIGHPLTQGTVDSNELWMDVTVLEGAQYNEKGERIDGRIIGRAGGMDEKKEVDPWSHFLNVFMLDRFGNRIDRRNAQDIFTPLYNHQIPPGAAQILHGLLYVPTDVAKPITVEVKLQYRKFDQRFMDFVAKFHREKNLPLKGTSDDGSPYVNQLPVMTIASDRMTFPVTVEQAAEIKHAEMKIPEWQRWNDYGIGLLLETSGANKGELRQAEQAFLKVESFKQFHGPLNLARVYRLEGRVDEAVDALNRAEAFKEDKDYPWWTAAWLTGEVNVLHGNFDEAIANFRKALYDKTEATLARKFDFSKDYRVLNSLGSALFDRSKQIANMDERAALLEESRAAFQDALDYNPEEFSSHYGLFNVYTALADSAREADLEGNPDWPRNERAFRLFEDQIPEALKGKLLTSYEDMSLADFYGYQAEVHRQLNLFFTPDTEAASLAVAKAREQYPWASKASEAVVIYSFHRPGAYELPADAARDLEIEVTKREVPSEASSTNESKSDTVDIHDVSTTKQQEVVKQ
jgi:tetratricopeptide (TPR) repeat protein